MPLSRNDQLADNALDAGESVRTLSVLDHFVAKYFGNATGHWLRAQVLLVVDCVDEVRRAVALDPRSTDAHYALGCAAWRLEHVFEVD